MSSIQTIFLLLSFYAASSNQTLTLSSTLSTSTPTSAESVVDADSGSLEQCGENPFTVKYPGNLYEYSFGCPTGYQCVNKQCQSPTGDIVESNVTVCSPPPKYAQPGVTPYCTTNFDLYSQCGYSLTMKDGFTYYFNCPAGFHCYTRYKTCLANVGGGPWNARPIITRCNATGMNVENGRCQSQCPINFQCIDTVL